MKDTKTMKLEDEILHAAIVNGAAQVWNQIAGYVPTAALRQFVAAAVGRALALGIVPDDEKLRTQAYADQKAREEASRLAALREEKARLIKELEELGEDAEGV